MSWMVAARCSRSAGGDWYMRFRLMWVPVIRR